MHLVRHLAFLLLFAATAIADPTTYSGQTWDERTDGTAGSGTYYAAPPPPVPASTGARSASSGGGSSGKSDPKSSQQKKEYQSNPSYLDALQAIQMLNFFMQKAGANPMDSSRRAEVQQAQYTVDVKMTQLQMEVKRGNMSASDYLMARQELSGRVDIDAPTRDAVKRDAAPGGDTISNTNVAINDPGPQTQTVSVNAPSGAAATQIVSLTGGGALRTPSAAEVQVLQAQGNAEPRAAKDINQVDTILKPEAGAAKEIAAADKTTLAVPVPLPVSEEKAVAATAEKLDKAELPVDPEEIAVQRRNDEGRERLAALTAAVADLAPGEVIGKIVAAGAESELHITGDFTGGKIIVGNFGDGVAAVKLRPTKAGYVIEKLTRGQLYAEYTKMGVLWVLLGIPLFYACFVLGVRITRRQRETAPPYRAAA